MSKLLTVEEIAEALNELPGWTQSGNAISRTFTLSSFSTAMEFANRVAALAERADHHPDILVQYKKVTLTLSTHSAGGLTRKDAALAREINGIAD